MGLDDESIVNEALLILIGGDETTRHVISGGMLALLDQPAQLAELAADIQTLFPVAVEELLRWVSPIKNMARTVTRDVEVRGQRAARRRPGHAVLSLGQPGRGGLQRRRPARHPA